MDQRLSRTPLTTKSIQKDPVHELSIIYHSTAPSYMLELCKSCDDSRLRSAACGNFIIPGTCLHVTDSSFTVPGPNSKGMKCTPIKTTYFSLQRCIPLSS